MRPQPTDTLSIGERTLAALIHLSGLLIFLIPYTNILFIYLIYKSRWGKSAFVDHHIKEGLNYNINVSIGMTISVFGMLFLLIGIIPGSIIAALHMIWSPLGAILAFLGFKFRYRYIKKFFK